MSCTSNLNLSLIKEKSMHRTIYTRLHKTCYEDELEEKLYLVEMVLNGKYYWGILDIPSVYKSLEKYFNFHFILSETFAVIIKRILLRKTYAILDFYIFTEYYFENNLKHYNN